MYLLHDKDRDFITLITDILFSVKENKNNSLFTDKLQITIFL